MSKLEMKLIDLSVRLTKSQRTLLQAKADKLGCTKSEYIRKILSEREIKQVVIPQINREVHQELAQLKMELVRQGVNFNQIARVLNAAEGVPPELILQLMELIGANQQSQVDVGICKTYVLMGFTDDRQN